MKSCKEVNDMIFDLLAIQKSLGEEGVVFVKFCEARMGLCNSLPRVYLTRLMHIYEMFVGKETKND